MDCPVNQGSMVYRNVKNVIFVSELQVGVVEAKQKLEEPQMDKKVSNLYSRFNLIKSKVDNQKDVLGFLAKNLTDMKQEHLKK